MPARPPAKQPRPRGNVPVAELRSEPHCAGPRAPEGLSRHAGLGQTQHGLLGPSWGLASVPWA